MRSLGSRVGATAATTLLVCVLAWSPAGMGQDATDTQSRTAAPPDRSAEQAAADQPLAGQDWTSPEFWRRIDGKPVETSWEFADGQIRLTDPSGGSASLLSPPLPAHFDLSWQYKISPTTNSGIKYRVRQFGSRWLGLEYQIIDEPLTPQAASRKGATASIYDLVAPTADKPNRPAGQWNDARVVARGSQIQHYLNGQLVAATDMRGPQWQYQVATSKFYGLDHFGEPVGENHIMLTDHGGEVVFKNFRFVPLAVKLPTAERVATEGLEKLTPPYLGNALRNGWADSQSIVLWTRTTTRPQMVTDGPAFIEPPRPLVAELNRSKDADRLLHSQLPDGAQLDGMLGACPGAPGEVRLTYFPAQQNRAAHSTAWQRTAAETDFTCQWKLQDLKADTRYAAVIEARPVGGDALTAVIRGEFRTAPTSQQPRPIRFCMTTCHDFLRRDDGLQGHKIYPAMAELEPDFVVHAGDIEYYDMPKPYAWTIPLMRFKWARIFSLPSNRGFYQQHTAYFIKDDHDTLKDDCWPGQHYGAVSFEQGVRLFNEEQFPSHSPRYKTVRWGKGLQIWLLEGRDFRSPNSMTDGPEKTILGDEQKVWLFDTLADSDADFKLIFSPTPIVGPDRDGKRDNHANQNFAHEGRQLRRELAKHPGVIVLCGDRHWQYASRDEDNGMWEFGCGPGSEEHQLGWKKDDERPEHQFLRVAGGFLSGQLAYPDGGDQPPEGKPTLTLHHRTVTGQQVSEFVFP